MNLKPITVSLWLADDDDPMAVYTVVETPLTSRFDFHG